LVNALKDKLILFTPVLLEGRPIPFTSDNLRLKLSLFGIMPDYQTHEVNSFCSYPLATQADTGVNLTTLRRPVPPLTALTPESFLHLLRGL